MSPRSRPTRLVVVGVLALTLVGVSCAGKDATTTSNDTSRLRGPPAADLPELEIRASGIDRFTTCPPPGDLGQHWIPPLAAWTPPPISADAGPPAYIDQDYIARTKDRTLTEIAVEQTHHDFRGCYRKGLVHYPTQDGRIAIVVRIAADGRVAKVETYAACELAPESISCMIDVAQHLRFPPPSGGSETVTIPEAFTSRDGVRRTVPTANDSYTAGAYVTIETARAQLHACEDSAHREGRPVTATGTFTMDIAPDGHVIKAHVDPWTGDQALLTCAAHAFETLKFAPPNGGGELSQQALQGKVIARLNFNPRQGTR